MATEAQADVTELLEQAAAGDESAKRQLFARVYEELRRKADLRLRGERVGHTLEATGLVHEVYCQLMKSQDAFTKGRRYFFGAASLAMQQILRAYWRHRNGKAEGHRADGDVRPDELPARVESSLGVDPIDLSEAIEELKSVGKHGARRHEVVRLRVWGGMTYQDIAGELGMSLANVERDWQAARA